MSKLLSAVVGLSMFGLVGAAGAAEPVTLTEAQMDVVSAGYNSWNGYSAGDASFSAYAGGDTLPYYYSYTWQDVYQTCYSGTCSSGNSVYASTNPDY